MYDIPANFLFICNDFPCIAYEGSVEIEDYIDEIDDVNNGIHDQHSDRVVLDHSIIFVTQILLTMTVDKPVDSQVVRHHNHSIEGKQEDNPIPYFLKIDR